jgi:hypothetical protein
MALTTPAKVRQRLSIEEYQASDSMIDDFIVSADGEIEYRNGFQETITDVDYKTAVERNQAAHAIVVDVASDAFTGFQNDALFHDLFMESVSTPMRAAYMFCRMYGYCGLLIGYADNGTLSQPADPSSKIEYLQPLPKNWIEEIVYKKVDGRPILPLTVDKYKVNMSTMVEG